MRRATLCLLLVCASAFAKGEDEGDVVAARAVFEKNIDAIRRRDRDTYLSLYLHSSRLVRGGPTGFTTGFDDFAKQAGSRWPDSIEASDIRLTPLRSGLVYGTYRYRVRYGAEEHNGISERLFVSTSDGWRIALTGAIDAPPGTPAPPRAIAAATLIDGRGGAPIPNANVILRDGRIDCAGTAAQCPLPEGVDVLEAKGMWITPGLVDAHVHFSQTGWADGRPDSIDVRAAHPYEKVEADLKEHPDRYARSYLCSGVTAVFDVGGYPWTLQLADRFANDTRTPHIAAAGPLLSTLDHWLNLPAERQFIHLKDEESGRAGVRYLAAHGARAIKVWYIVRPPDLTADASAAAVIAAGDEARKENLPLIVHATGLAEAKAALHAGAKLLVHSVWDREVDQEFIDLAKRNGTILTPTLTVLRGYVRMFKAALDRKEPAIDDPNHCVDRTTRARIAETVTVGTNTTEQQVAERDQRAGAREQTMAANLKALVAAGVPIATGTDAGNPLTLHGPAIYAEMEAMQAAGMTPMQVIIASTINGARATGIEKQTGSIERGKEADLLLVGADPSANVANFRKIRFVVRAGVVRSIDDLRSMVEGE